MQTPEQYAVVTGADAARVYEAINGINAPSQLEAILTAPDSGEIVMFLSIREGYVRFDDWGDVNADSMLKEFKDGTEEANATRQANGLQPLHVIGWRDPPALDRAEQTVHWSIIGKSSNDNDLMNADVLTFGRYGYEKLIWAGPGNHDPRALLGVARAGFTFDTGAKYTDFHDGDKVATYGVAAVVAAAVGAKVAAKLGLLAVILAFAKKGIVVIIALGGAGLAMAKRFLRRLPTGRSSEN